MEMMTSTPASANDTGITLEQAAQGFAAIGSEPRLAVLRALVRAGPEGLSVGEIQKRLEIAASTLTHHLRFLASAGLIEQTRDGRVIRNRAAFARVEALAAYLLSECCAERGGHAQTCPHGRAVGETL
jgi:ArsR family transcriptional regulator